MTTKQVILLSLLIRLLIIPFFYHPDIKSQYFHFQFLSQDVNNIYQYISDNKYNLPNRDTFNYLPLTYFTFGSYFSFVKHISLPDLSNWLNDWGNFKNSYPNLPYFLLSLKFPYLIADYLLALILLKLYRRPEIFSLWLLNPISIYLIYILGNFDVIPVLLTLSSYYFLTKNKNILPFFLLGIAISLKLYPLIFLPFFLFYNPINIKKIILNTLATIFPLLISLLPFIYYSSFWSSFFGSGLTQKILEFKIVGIPIFPVGYLTILSSYLFSKTRFPENFLNFEKHMLFLFLLFISTVNFHPQWILWFFPFVLVFNFFKPKIRSLILITLLLIFIYIALINDQYLFWGHLIPIDLAFTNTPSPYQLIIKYSLFKPEFVRQLLQLIFFAFLLLLTRFHEKNTKN